MRIRIPAWALIAAALLSLAQVAPAEAAPAAARKPPMGWNSWDAYGFTIDEGQFKAGAAELAKLKALGWTYAVIDEGWYMDNPFGAKLADRAYQLDAHGLLVPSPKRFPSAADGTGFKHLAAWAHARGLKFGIHIVRGIPKQAVEQNTPIAGSDFHAADAADTSETCPWDDGDFGVRDNAAGQAYYDSMIRLYAGWGVDFLKVDCIADHPFRPTEIRQIHDAIRKVGGPMVLSLSPGPTQLEHADVVSRQSQMWRIADDIWDGWRFEQDGKPLAWPNGVASAFDNLAKWSAYAGPGHWPDADMLPFGVLKPHPGWGDPRVSGLTPDEARTQFTLWAIARSPLILGANLTQLDDATRALITNRAVIAIDQTAWASHPVALPAGFEGFRAWIALTGSRAHPTRYLAVFNLGDAPAHLAADWDQLGLPSGRHGTRDLWSGARTAPATGPAVDLPAHGSTVFRVE